METGHTRRKASSQDPRRHDRARISLPGRSAEIRALTCARASGRCRSVFEPRRKQGTWRRSARGRSFEFLDSEKRVDEPEDRSYYVRVAVNRTKGSTGATLMPRRSLVRRA